MQAAENVTAEVTETVEAVAEAAEAEAAAAEPAANENGENA